MNRPLLKQEATTFAVAVGLVGTPVAPNMQLTALVDSFVISVAADIIFMGFDQGVTITNGLQLGANTLTQFSIDHDGRQLYELQFPLTDIRNGAMCKTDPIEQIPFVVWDMSQIFLVGAAATTVSVSVFKAVYV